MSKYFKLILVASVGLNILLVGIISGHISHRYLWQSASYHARMQLAEQLPEEQRKLFKDTMHSAWQETENIRAQIADAKKEAGRLLEAYPINEDAYFTQIQHINDLNAQMKKRMAQAMLKLAQQFTPTERAILADMISHPHSDNPPAPSTEDKDKERNE